jgi:CelD/BcsL family acetyltransferase involved in cellulose biosynthesis
MPRSSTPNPTKWEGVSNPFAKLPHQRAVSNGFAVTLGDFDKMWHERFGKQSPRNFDRKERKLAEMGTLDYGWAETEAERLALVETLFAQRLRQYAELASATFLTKKAAPSIASLRCFPTIVRAVFASAI